MSERRLITLIPNAEDFLALEPEELAGVLLDWLNSLDLPNFSRRALLEDNTLTEYPERYHDDMRKAMMEGFVWLEREGFIAELPPGNTGAYYITRRGKRVTQASDLGAYRKADLLPRRLLHATIAQKCWSPFLRGDYDMAALQAIKEVEVSVRAAGNFTAEDFGVPMMRKAFNVNDGPLRDRALVTAERQAMSDIFAGAIGLYKNSLSHRNVPTDAENAAEIIVIASHLLKKVDSLAKSPP